MANEGLGWDPLLKIWVGVKTWYENPDPILWHVKFYAAAFIRRNIPEINTSVFSCSTGAFRFTASGTGILRIRAKMVPNMVEKHGVSCGRLQKYHVQL